MPSSTKKPARKRDENEIAASIIGQIIAGTEQGPTPEEISKVMSELGRKGGRKGGHARSQALSKKRRREIASAAAKARWKGK